MGDVNKHSLGNEAYGLNRLEQVKKEAEGMRPNRPWGWCGHPPSPPQLSISDDAFCLS